MKMTMLCTFKIRGSFFLIQVKKIVKRAARALARAARVCIKNAPKNAKGGGGCILAPLISNIAAYGVMSSSE